MTSSNEPPVSGMDYLLSEITRYRRYLEIIATSFPHVHEKPRGIPEGASWPVTETCARCLAREALR